MALRCVISRSGAPHVNHADDMLQLPGLPKHSVMRIKMPVCTAAALPAAVPAAPVPPDGARLRIGRPASGANDILIERTGAALIATLPASTACQVDLIVRGGVVRGSFASVGATIEASW